MTQYKHPEKTLYKTVSVWLKEHFKCFKTEIDKGLRISRIDVVGVRDVGGDLSGEVETIAVEVKRGSSPFATACGQTLGYNVCANRVYLADIRSGGFSLDELDIASHLGIGLVQIRGTTCVEVRSSPFYKPIEKFHFALLERLRLGRCQWCGSVFEIGDAKRHSNLVRENIATALAQKKGLMFGNRELAKRKAELGVRGIRQYGKSAGAERRFICPNCIAYVVAQLRREL